MSRDKLIDEILSLENFNNGNNSTLSELTDRFNKFHAEYKMVKANPSISKQCIELLLEHNIQVEHNKLNNPLYNQKETLEINAVPSDANNSVL